MANQFLFPVEGSTTVLAAATDSEGWTQTGYKVHIIGSLIHGLVNLCFLGIQFLLFVLTIFYYIADEGITRWDAPIESDTQALMAFEIVWMVGFFWCFAFRYPSIYSVQSLFLRRCHLDKATHVAITAPTKAVNVKETTSTGMSIQRFINIVWWPIDNLFQRIFWIPHARKGTTTTFCKIEIDKNTAGRSFYHRMRRYVYDDESGTFVLGTMTVGSTLGDFLDQAQGLTSEEVVQRTARVGRNMIHMTKPTILGSIGKEFSKTFYLFQNFMVWTWFPFWNFHLALMQTIVRLTGGCTVAIFQYMSDSVLYSISHPVEGKVEVLRDGQFIDVAQTELVPGDVIVLTPGTAGCDMIVLKADHVLVDESSLTGEATPVAKSEIDPMMKNETYDSKKHKSSTVSAGTTVLEVGKKDKTLALITKTGSFTAKGELLSDVLSYERHKFKFDQEVKLVLFILLLEAIFMFSMVIYWLQDQ
jgi:cation-transporting ATPase 13A3/4/5